jgi:hypothetical protein
MTNHLDRASPTAPTPTVPLSSVTPLSVAATLIEALGWSVVSAVAVAMVGFYGHRIGSSWYPQRYEGMPSDIFFIPLGSILGVVVAVTARLARPMWRATQMFAVIALASLGYGGLLYEYARSHALAAGFTITSFRIPFDTITALAVEAPSGR